VNLIDKLRLKRGKTTQNGVFW